MVGLRFAPPSGSLRRGAAGCAGAGFSSGTAHGDRRVGRAPLLVRLLIALAVALVGGCSDEGDRAAEGEATTTTVVRTTAEEAPVAVGDCGNLPGLQVGGALDPATIELADCAVPHDVEVGAVFDYPAGAGIDFPGTAAVDGYATDQCIERFEAYVGAAYEASTLDVLIVAPDADGWGDGDRRIACVLYHVDFQDLTGSVAGSGQ